MSYLLVVVAFSTFFWRVLAEDRAGNRSAFSVIFSFTVDTEAPASTINEPRAIEYRSTGNIVTDFSATDDASGVKTVLGELEGRTFQSGDTIDLTALAPGSHTFTVTAEDQVGNRSTNSVTFRVALPELVSFDDIVGRIRELLADPEIPSRAKRHLQRSLDFIIGNNDGLASNSAQDLLASGKGVESSVFILSSRTCGARWNARAALCFAWTFVVTLTATASEVAPPRFPTQTTSGACGHLTL